MQLAIPRTPFIVPYRLDGDTIQILRIFYSARRWPESFSAVERVSSAKRFVVPLLGNRRWCYPLAVTDHASRVVLLCDVLETIREYIAFSL